MQQLVREVVGIEPFDHAGGFAVHGVDQGAQQTCLERIAEIATGDRGMSQRAPARVDQVHGELVAQRRAVLQSLQAIQAANLVEQCGGQSAGNRGLGD